MSEEKKEEKKPTATISEALAGLAVVLIVIAFFGGILFWPWSTEGVVSRVNYAGFGRESCFITFDDGRTLRLSGQPSRSLIVGKHYRITYNNLRFFYSVEEVEQVEKN